MGRQRTAGVGAGWAGRSLPTQPFCDSMSPYLGLPGRRPTASPASPSHTLTPHSLKARPPIPAGRRHRDADGRGAARRGPPRLGSPRCRQYKSRRAAPFPARRPQLRTAAGPRPSRSSLARPHLSGAAGVPPTALRLRPPRRSAAAGRAGRPPCGQGSVRGGAGPGRAAHGAAGRAGMGGLWSREGRGGAGRAVAGEGGGGGGGVRGEEEE